MTVDEIAAKGVTNAVTDVAKLVTDWRHAPIIDYGVPGPAFEAAWPALSTDLHQLIDDGKRVLIHCHGGIGRSGLISARLLVDRGLSPAAAVAAVRSVPQNKNTALPHTPPKNNRRRDLKLQRREP